MALVETVEGQMSTLTVEWADRSAQLVAVVVVASSAVAMLGEEAEAGMMFHGMVRYCGC